VKIVVGMITQALCSKKVPVSYSQLLLCCGCF